MTIQKITTPPNQQAVLNKINEVIDKKIENTATGEDSLTALGYATNQDYSINIGKNSRANDESAVAIGPNAKVIIPSEGQAGDSEGSIAIGSGAESQGIYALSIGRIAKAQGEGAISIGSSTHAYSQGSVAIGYQSETSNYGTVAIGPIAKATNFNAMQLGNGTNNEEDTLYVGFTPTRNYKMLDYYGKIPDDRLNNTIARTSQIPTIPVLATVATTGSYDDLTNKPTIPAAVTESTVSGWGFTKNTGTVTSVNNVSPVSGNVTISIPTVPTIATSVSASSTNAETVGAKLFYDTVGNIESALNTINSGS